MHHTDIPAIHTALSRALDGGPPLQFGHPTQYPQAAVTLPTTGSTGTPRHVALPASAIRAAVTATHHYLGGPGHWVLVLPANRIAGIQVLARAHLGGLGYTAAPTTSFSPEYFTDITTQAHRRAPHSPRYVSLVPTQLHRIITAAHHGHPAALTALNSYDAVLVGGAALPDTLRDPITTRLISTYGMTETAGGCVYNGQALQGVTVTTTNGTITITGPMVALGYTEPDPDHSFTTLGDTRSFHTKDHGHWEGAPPRLHIEGRLDDLIISGGLKIAPLPLENTIRSLPAIADVCVIGVPHPEWGQQIVAVVTLNNTANPAAVPEEITTLVRSRHGSAATPKRVIIRPELPYIAPGKVNRRTITEWASTTAHP